MQSKPLPPTAKLIMKYIPKELLPTSVYLTGKDEHKVCQNLIDNSTGRLPMYSSGNYLLDDLTRFQFFPRSYEVLGFDIKDQLKNCPHYHSTIQGATYVYKSDLYTVLYRDVACFMPFKKDLQKTLVLDCLSFFLKKIEAVFSLTAEMTELPEVKLESLAETFKQMATMFVEKDLENIDNERKENEIPIEKLCENWTYLLKLDKNDKDAQRQFRSLLEKAFEDIPYEENRRFYHKASFWFSRVVPEFMEFFLANPEHFTPQKLLGPSKVAIVRLFCGDFVLVHEVLRSLKQANLDVTSIEKEILSMHKLSAWTFREFMKKVDMEIMKKIVFVVTNDVQATQFSSTPIPIESGGYCILATDCLLDLITHLIVAKRIFRVASNEHLPLIEKFFDDILECLEAFDAFLVELEQVEELKSKCDKFFDEHFKDKQGNNREIRNVRKTGFSTNDVKKELQYLGIDKVFPESFSAIEGNDEIVHFGNAEMHNLVKDMQEEMVFLAFPKVLQFIHKRKECGRFEDFRCSLCLDEKEAAGKVKKETNSEKVVVLEMEKPEEPVEEISIPETPSEIEREVKMKSDLQPKNIDKNTSEEIKQKKKKIKTKKTSVGVPEPPKESQACPKCIRASEYTRETNEKLRLSKIDVKALTKKLAQNQKENEEQNIRISLLEKKLLEQECQLKEKDALIKKLENLSLKNSEEMEKQNETIELLKTKLVEQEESIPKRSLEDSKKVKDCLLELSETRKTLKAEAPIEKAEKVISKLAKNSRNKETKLLAESEMRMFQIQCSSYIKVLEGNIKLVQNNQTITMDQIPDLLDFPQFSQEFLDQYRKILKEKAPLICQSLLKPQDCSICLGDVFYNEEVSKCDKCNKKCHMECVKEWLNKNGTCPSCRAKMLDEEDYPRLGSNR